MGETRKSTSARGATKPAGKSTTTAKAGKQAGSTAGKKPTKAMGYGGKAKTATKRKPAAGAPG